MALDLSFGSDLGGSDEDGGPLSSSADGSSSSLDTMISQFRTGTLPSTAKSASSSAAASPTKRTTVLPLAKPKPPQSTFKPSKHSQASAPRAFATTTPTSAPTTVNPKRATERVTPLSSQLVPPKPKPSLKPPSKPFKPSLSVRGNNQALSPRKPPPPPPPRSPLIRPHSPTKRKLQQQHASIDEMISRDIEQLHRMIASNRGPPSPKKKTLDRGPSSPTRPRVPVRSVLKKPLPSPQKLADEDDADEDDAFDREIQALRVSYLQKQLDKASADPTPQDTDADTGIQEPHDVSAAIRETATQIDRAMLLAFQPFEQMKKNREAADAEAQKHAPAADAANAVLELPLAAQAIVGQLDQAFGEMTRTRHAEVKAESEATAAAKAAEETKKKEDEAKKKADEAAAVARDREVLDLIPLRGKLLTSDADVEHALLRLELAETTTAGRTSGSVDDQMVQLRQAAMERARAIEARLMTSIPEDHRAVRVASVAVGRQQSVDWRRDAFEDGSRPPLPSTRMVGMPEGVEDVSRPMGEILQQHVLEKLELTMLKLKHVLAIDAKEQAEADAKKQREADEQRKLQEEKTKEAAKLAQQQADADAARQRVMGLTSLDQIENWMPPTQQQPPSAVEQDAALRRLMDTMEQRPSSIDRAMPSFFDTKRAMERFDCMKDMMTRPNARSSPMSHRTRNQPRANAELQYDRAYSWLPTEDYRVQDANDYPSNQYDEDVDADVVASDIWRPSIPMSPSPRPSPPKSTMRRRSSSSTASPTTRTTPSHQRHSRQPTMTASNSAMDHFRSTLQSFQSDRRAKASYVHHNHQQYHHQHTSHRHRQPRHI